MKKLLTMVFIGLVLSACKKSGQDIEEISGNPEKYLITFNAGLQATQKDYRTGVSDLSLSSAHLKYFYYFLYDSAGNFVKRRTQIKGSDTDFGQIRDTVAPGVYQAVFFGAQYPVQFEVGNYNNSRLLFANNDVFQSGAMLTVDRYPQSETVTMDRVISKLTTQIQDVVPQNASYLKVAYRMPKYYYFNGTTIVGPGTYLTKDTTIQLTSLRGKTVPPFSIITSPNQQSLEMTAYDVTDKLIAFKTLPVTPKPNKETLLTGIFFVGDAAFTILLNPEWAPTQTIEID